jgi:hypothetical protein
VGGALTALGITSRKRNALGWQILLTTYDKKKIHELVEAYGIDSDEYWPTAESCKRCPLCTDLTHPMVYAGKTYDGLEPEEWAKLDAQFEEAQRD